MHAHQGPARRAPWRTRPTSEPPQSPAPDHASGWEAGRRPFVDAPGTRLHPDGGDGSRTVRRPIRGANGRSPPTLRACCPRREIGAPTFTSVQRDVYRVPLTRTRPLAWSATPRRPSAGVRTVPGVTTGASGDWARAEDLGRLLFVNENISGHATMHLHMFRALAEHPEVAVERLDVPSAGLVRRGFAAQIPGLDRLDLDLSPLRFQLAQSAQARSLIRRRLAQGSIRAIHAYSQHAVLLSANELRRFPSVVSTDGSSMQNADAAAVPSPDARYATCGRTHRAVRTPRVRSREHRRRPVGVGRGLDQGSL